MDGVDSGGSPFTPPRAHPRFEVHAYVDVAAGPVEPLHLAVRNLSLGGICIHAADPERICDVGTAVELLLAFPDLDGTRLELRGRVVWVSREPPAEMGIRFVDLDPGHGQLLREYLRRAALLG